MSDERRIVTILFADVAGSTALGEALDPEDMRALLARYYAIAREVIEAHGGTLEKFIGDAVMAIFGLPRAHGDDAERALAATELLRARLRAEPALARIEVRFGVSTGEVVASRNRGSGGDFLVTGDAVNLAARLQQAAEVGEILCSERTARAAARRFVFAAPRELQLRGKALQVNGHPLAHRVTAEAPSAVPMIGRDADLEQLQLAARRAFAEARPQLVSIIAPAGAGKTRLVEEFLAALPASAGAPLVAIAQCLPYGQRLTFWPLRAVLHRFVGIAGDAPVDDLQARVGAWLATRGVDEPDRTGELLASTVGAAETAQPDRVAMFNAWRSAVQAAGATGPVVIVFEDLHWSSDTLLDLVEHVMQPWAQLPILMLALTRPELLDRRPTWGGGKRNHTSIALEPLDDSACAELVRRLLQTDSAEVVRRVVARAGGNPFYASELVRAVAEQAVDAADPASMEDALSHLPDTVHAAVLARLDLLPPDDRWVLQLGAVLGRSFSADGVAALGAIAAATARESCGLLVERDLLRPAADTYAFRHILIREVAYQALPRSERARLHSAAAEWLEARAAGSEEAMAELVAFHFREAVALGGAAVSAETRVRAVDWLARAADAAFTGAASVEGLAHLRAAIELAVPERLIELNERLGERMQSGTAADAPLRAALDLSESQDRPAAERLRILARLLMFAMRAQGSVAARMSDERMAALRARGRALLADVDPEGPEAARFLAADAFYPYWKRGETTAQEFKAAAGDARLAATIAERDGDADLLSASLDALTAVLVTRGDYQEALAISQRRVALGRKLAVIERLDAYSMVAWLSSALGDFAIADSASAEGLAQVQPGQEPAWTMHLVAWRIYAMTVMGRWDTLKPLALRARQLWEEIHRETAGYALHGFIPGAQALRSRGDPVGESLGDAAAAILHEFEGAQDVVGGVRWRWLSLLQLDRAGLEEATAGWKEFVLSPDALERQLSAMCDRGWCVPPSTTEPMLQWAMASALRPLEMQLRRATALREHDLAQLEHAATIAVACAAASPLARLRFEIARIRNDKEGMEIAIEALEAMGDRGQIALYRS